jgi:cell division protein FtsB
MMISYDDLRLVFQWRFCHSKSFGSALSLTLTFRYAPSLHSPSRREAYEMRGQNSQILRQMMLLAALIGMIVYVGADAVRGPHGLVANQMLRAKIALMKKDLATLKTQRARLERDAELLGPKAASQPDLLDEQARSLLDFARATDIVIVNSERAH